MVAGQEAGEGLEQYVLILKRFLEGREGGRGGGLRSKGSHGSTKLPRLPPFASSGSVAAISTGVEGWGGVGRGGGGLLFLKFICNSRLWENPPQTRR